MSASLWTHSPARPVGRILDVGNRLATFAAGIVREWRIRRDLAAISELGPRELADIGIGQGGIEGALRHGRRWAERNTPTEHGGAPERGPLPSSWTEWR